MKYCYLIIRNSEASLVEVIESRDRRYKRVLLLLLTNRCNMNANNAF